MWTKCSADLSLTLKPPACFTGKENQRTEKSSDLPPSHTSQKSQNLPLVTLLAEAHGSPPLTAEGSSACRQPEYSLYQVSAASQ